MISIKIAAKCNINMSNRCTKRSNECPMISWVGVVYFDSISLCKCMYILNVYHNNSANVRFDSFDRFTTSNKIRQMLPFWYAIYYLYYRLHIHRHKQTHTYKFNTILFRIKWYEFRHEMPIPLNKSNLLFI